MNKKILTAILISIALPGSMLSAPADSLRLKSYKLDEVVVTGTRDETDIRHLPMTISVVGRQQLEQTYQPSILPTLTEQVPGLFTTSRGIMGYGVSTGAAGGMSLRGIGAGVNAAGGPTTSLLVLIDGHPQYMGLMGHPIADAYQSMMAERVEVLRGPASVLYGSNAMGGVINIVTRKMQEDGVKTNAQIGYGSYNTLQTEVSNRVRKGRFSSVVTGSYNRTADTVTTWNLSSMAAMPTGIRLQRHLEAVGRREHHPLQRLQSRRSRQSVYRQRLAHHTRHDLLRTGKSLRPYFRRRELLL